MENTKNIIINVGRQLGSGGRVIAKQLAEDLGCEFYDKELLNLAAKESGFSEKIFEENDENTNFFKSLFHMNAPYASGHYFYSNKLSQESLFQFQSDAIRKAAENHSCVFVGRCADYVLRDFDNKVDIFITASLENRIKRISKIHSCSDEEAEKLIEHGESIRSSYYNYYTGKTWGDGKSYDLCINSGILGIDGTVDFIKEFVRRKFAL
ncbi:MAG: cytidylate kinase-like family protein [Prevotella sp.]|nr:cytidylate kinase-like family protein [Prevotella sp.]